MRPPPLHAPRGYVFVDALDGWRLDGTTVECVLAMSDGSRAHLQLSQLSPAIWRTTFLPPGTERPEPSPMVVLRPDSPPMPSVSEDPAGITIAGPCISIRMLRNPFSVSYLDRSGEEILRHNPSDIDGIGRPLVLPLGFRRSTNDVPLVADSFHLAADEHLFGLGEKFTALDKRGQTIVSWTQDAFGSTSERSHKNVPFVWSTRGYGVFLDCTERITWELGTQSTQSYTIIAESDVLDTYVICGPTPAEILSAYAGLTGRAPVPPLWSFGLWVSSGGTYRDRAAVEALVDGLDTHGIHASVVHVDPWWMHWRRYCDFVWNDEAFPRHEEFIRSLHSRGLRLCLWEHPYISVESELFRIGKERGFFARRPDGSVYVIDYGLSLAPRPDGIVRTATGRDSWNARVAIIDLTNPRAVEWFKDLHRPLLREGVDVFKTDFGEDVPEDAVFSDRSTGRAVHNLYPLLYNKAVFEVTSEENGDGIVWSRSGTSGNQRYPVCWSGDPASDFDSLASTIRGGLSAGMSGIPFWSNDIGGYRGTPSEELYIRWAQFGLMCSHARMHGDSPREPWVFGEKALAIVRTYINLRHRLLPYLFSIARESSLTGLPVLRALPVAFPDDPNVYDKDFEFLLGPMLLIAPIVETKKYRNVYIPAGEWIDWWNGGRIRGPQTLRVPAPIELLPMFVRGGGLVPMLDEPQPVPGGAPGPVTMHLFPGGSSSLTYDDGSAVRTFVTSAAERQTFLEWTGETALELSIHIHGTPARYPVSVALDGKQFAHDRLHVEPDATGVRLTFPPSKRGTIVFE